MDEAQSGTIVPIDSGAQSAAGAGSIMDMSAAAGDGTQTGEPPPAQSVAGAGGSEPPAQPGEPDVIEDSLPDASAPVEDEVEEEEDDEPAPDASFEEEDEEEEEDDEEEDEAP